MGGPLGASAPFLGALHCLAPPASCQGLVGVSKPPKARMDGVSRMNFGTHRCRSGGLPGLLPWGLLWRKPSYQVSASNPGWADAVLQAHSQLVSRGRGQDIACWAAGLGERMQAGPQ